MENQESSPTDANDQPTSNPNPTPPLPAQERQKFLPPTAPQSPPPAYQSYPPQRAYYNASSLLQQPHQQRQQRQVDILCSLYTGWTLTVFSM